MFDIVIIGAGVIGLSIARAIGRITKKTVLVIEKEDSFGRGISSRNSEVIHSGIYYNKDSLKSKYCNLGRELIYDYCKKNNIWHNKCGKIIVCKKHQLNNLEKLFNNGLEIGIPKIDIINKKQIELIESKINADFAIQISSTGIISAHGLMASFYRKSQEKGHDYLFKSRVLGANQKNDGYILDIENPNGETEQVACDWVINASGLESDIVGQMIGKKIPGLKYSQGCYFKLSSKWRHSFKRLIYPLPDKEKGSLGIHLTIDELGMARLGPSAHWLKSRVENYDVDDLLINEFYNSGKSYIKNLEKIDITPDYSGIRPKIWLEKHPMPDFYISHEDKKGLPKWINLIGIESPGLTSSIAIGNDVASWVT